MSGQWSPERSAQGAVAQTYATYFKRPQRRAGRSGGHPKGAPTSAHCMRGIRAPRLRAPLSALDVIRPRADAAHLEVDALTTHF